MAKANFDKAKAEYPTIDSMHVEEWVQFFASPDGVYAMGRIFGDIWEAVMTEEEKARGITRMGRRPRRQGTLDEVMATVLPQQYTLEPFKVALRGLMGGRSTRAFAPQVPCHQATLVRLLNGDYKPDLAMMESIAKAAKIHPKYFVEYRAGVLAESVRVAMSRQPNLGLRAYRALVEARDSS